MQDTTQQTATCSTSDKAGKSVLEISSIRILKLGNCPTLSGRSSLTYHVGCNSTGAICFRVTGNTGGGFFNANWIALETIQNLLEKLPSDKALTSQLFYPLFRGRSMNSPAFLLAVLKTEGLVQLASDKQRRYEPADMTVFMAEVRGLITSAVDIQLAGGSKVDGKAASVMPSSLKPGSGKKAKVA